MHITERLTIIILIYSLVTVLSACDAESPPAAGVGADGGQLGSDAASAPDAQPLLEPPLECDDLDRIIMLADQLAANAHATRGRYPIVLGHGFFGFDRVGPLEYFNGAAERMREAGFAVYIAAVAPIASSEDVRGPELGRQVGCIATLSGAGKINLVGHSQGGLDARVVAADPRYSRYVATVSTVATPHRGSLVADAALGLVPGVSEPLVDAIAELWGTAADAPADDPSVHASLVQLSVAYSPEFNLAHPDNPAVEYFSWSGRSVLSALNFDYGDQECAGGIYANPDARDLIGPHFSLTFEFIASMSGRNDGLVTIASSKWGTFMGCVPADHLDEIGMFALTETNPFSGFSHCAFFVSLAGDLEARGY